MLIFSKRKYLSWEVVCIELFLLAMMGLVVMGSMLGVGRLWIDSPQSVHWWLDVIVLAGMPVMAITLQFFDSSPQLLTPISILGSWFAGAAFGVILHIAEYWYFSHIS